jgi:hypothetical protein
MSGISIPVEFARLIAISEGMGDGYMTELLRPASRGELTLMLPSRGTVQPPFRRLAKKARPIVALVGDDDYATTGPDGWACADKLRRWANFAVVHGTGGQRQHYASAAVMAARVRRLLFIETSSTGAQLWAGFLAERIPPLTFMGLLPPVGAHPVMPAKGEVH